METRALDRVRDAARASPAEMLLLALVGLAVAGGALLVYLRRSDPPPQIVRTVRQDALREEDPPADPRPPRTVLVHVAGMVAAPGVYELPGNSRVKDAIAAAGGPKDGGDIDALNLAAPLHDGQKITVRKPGDPVPPEASAAGGPQAAPVSGKIDLNTATVAELDTLPSVGPVIAARIVAFREKSGRFTSVSQLQDVEGIGPKKYEGIKDLVTV